MTRTALSLVFFFVLSINLNAQHKDTILLMNGNYVVEKVIDTLIGAVTIINPANTAE